MQLVSAVCPTLARTCDNLLMRRSYLGMQRRKKCFVSEAAKLNKRRKEKRATAKVTLTKLVVVSFVCLHFFWPNAEKVYFEEFEVKLGDDNGRIEVETG